MKQVSYRIKIFFLPLLLGLFLLAGCSLLPVERLGTDSGTIEPRRHKWPCFYNISKIRKSDFPYEPRDFLMHAVQ